MYQKLILIIGLLASAVSLCQAQQLAFPGAEGYGRFTTGGRGGMVILVTNLNDDGPGSLRDAVETKGARTIVFRVSGTIPLESELIIKKANLTIAGQTAPGDGICLKGYPLIVNADNVIVRYLRIRPGDIHKTEVDALSAISHKNIIIDHCSASWAIDEVVTVRDNENSTVQWCIISESLRDSYHHKGEHGYGGIWGGQGASFHHNLLAHHSSRNPRFNGSRYSRKPEKERVDFRNNVIYNWGFNSGYGGEGGDYNLVANYYKYGPASRHKNRIVEPLDDEGKWFIADNFVSGFPEITANNWAGGVQGDYWDEVKSDSLFPVDPVITHTADSAYTLVLAKAGAILPVRDAVDRRIIEEVSSGTAKYGKDGKGLIDSQTEVGGWPELRTYDVPVDEDADGMADAWERGNGLNPADAADRNSDSDGDGYTNLEEFLNSLTERSRPVLEMDLLRQ